MKRKGTLLIATASCEPPVEDVRAQALRPRDRRAAALSRTIRLRHLLPLALALFGAVATAQAGVAAYTGDVAQLDPPPASVATGTPELESDKYVWLFAEQVGVTLTAPLAVDMIAPGTYDDATPASPGTIPAGYVVNSYFLHLDRVGTSSAAALTLNGSVVFDETILGVIFSYANLNNSDTVVGNPTTTYNSTDSNRGLSSSVSDPDTVVWSGTGTIEVQLPNFTSTDQVRIITGRRLRNITFSLDRQSASVCGTQTYDPATGAYTRTGRIPSFGTGTGNPVPVFAVAPALGLEIGEGDILTVGTVSPGPNPPTAALVIPGVFISSSAFLPAAMSAREITSLSFGRDEPDGRLYFSVDKFAYGRAGVPAAPLLAEIAANDESADVFSSASASPLSGAAPKGNRAVIDGDGSSRPGLGLLEPNPLHVPGTFPDTWPDSGDNLDALDIGTKATDANGFIYFSLDGDGGDALMRTTEWIPTPLVPAGGYWVHPGGYDSAGQLGLALGSTFSCSEVLVTKLGGPVSVYASAAALGLTQYSDAVDALALRDTGPNGVQDDVFDPTVDRLYFSLRRNSSTIGLLDSALGLAIEEGDVLTVPAAAGGTPAIAIPGEDIGLRTVRSGAPLPSGYGDELNALDFVLDISAAPAINDIPDQAVQENQPAGPLNLIISDPDTSSGELILSGRSSNPALVPTANIVFSGSGSNRTVSVTPRAGQSGSATITIAVSDGESSASDSFVLTVTPALPGQFCADFAQGLPAGTTVSGRGTTPPYVAGGVLHLTDALNSQENFWTTPITRQTVQSVSAQWKTLIGGGTGALGADGLSFNLGTDLGAFTPEEGSVSGLSVTVDTWDNGDQDDVGIEIKWNGGRIGFTRSGDGTTDGQGPLRRNRFVDTTLEVTSSGLATFQYAGLTVSAQLPSYRGIDANQYVFAARTGGANDNHWIDEVCVRLSEAPPAATDVKVAFRDLPSTAVSGQPMSYSIVVSNVSSVTATGLSVIVTHQGSVAAGPIVMTSQGSCEVVDNEVRCITGPLNAGQSAIVRITVTPGLQESLGIEARAVLAMLDSNLFDNLASGRVVVVPLFSECFCSCFTNVPWPNPDPLLYSWYTVGSGQYARVRLEDGASPQTGWHGGNTRAGTDRNVPLTYADIQNIQSSPNFVYITAAGLASYVMGPWYCDPTHSVSPADFPNLPLDIQHITKIPRNPIPNSGHPVTPLGAMGIWVNGTAIYNMLDGYYYVPSKGHDTNNFPPLWSTPPGGVATLTGYWHRDAYFAERSTFDPAEFHSQMQGEYHSHASPLDLRKQLGDNRANLSLPIPDIDPVSGAITGWRYIEVNVEQPNPAQWHHSPILGWAFDGHPIYGPYGYSDPMDTNSAIGRVRSGYVLRDGSYGTTDLRKTGRTTLPAWTRCMQGRTSQILTASEYGPDSGSTASTDTACNPIEWKLGRYAEDYAYLGDLLLAPAMGAEWDLDRYNGRCCKTPEFPNGTYAYFVTLDTNGVPAFPYIVGWQYCSQTNGGVVTSIAETTTVYFENTDVPVIRSGPTFTGPSGSRQIALVWSSLEGGTYHVETTEDFQTWTPLTPSVTATSGMTEFEYPRPVPLPDYLFYRVAMDALAPYNMHLDKTSGFTFRWPSAASAGSTVTVTIVLSPTATPPLPPPAVAPLGASIGNVMASSFNRTGNTITATFDLPDGMAGNFALTVAFPGPITYTLTDGFSVN